MSLVRDASNCHDVNNCLHLFYGAGKSAATGRCNECIWHQSGQPLAQFGTLTQIIKSVDPFYVGVSWSRYLYIPMVYQ